MKRNDLFPLLIIICLISLTYKRFEGFSTPCPETGKKAYKAWKECYDAYSNVCSKGEAYKKYFFCKKKVPCAELRRQFNVHKKLCPQLNIKKQEIIQKFKSAL